MAQSPPPLWNMPSAGAPPAGATTPAAKRYETFGNVSLALGAVELLNCVQRLLSPLFTRNLLGFQRAFMPKTRGGPPIDDIFSAAQRLGQRLAIWEAARAVPFLVATGVLMWIAMRLRNGDSQALFAMRRWTFAALGVVALSALIQVLVNVPATMDYQREIAALTPASSHDVTVPFDFGAVMASVTLAATMIGLIGGVMVFSIWPIVAYVWSTKLIRETLTQRSE